MSKAQGWRRLSCRVSVLGAVLICGLFGLQSDSIANPLPSGVILVHVQPVTSDFCSTNPITDCEDIVQYTDASGTLEFDLYIQLLEFEPPISYYSLNTVVQWSPGWALLDWEFCHDGTGSVDVVGNEATVDIVWPSCPQAEGEVFLAARFVVEVTGYGKFGTLDWNESTVFVGCPPLTYSSFPFLAAAEAGVECSYCFVSCTFEGPCQPVPDPAMLDLSVIQGQASVSEIHIPVFGGLTWPCAVSFVPTEDWMTFSYEEIGWNDYMVTLTVETAGLEPGFYEGWFRAEDACVGCTKVNLEVLPPVNAVPGDDPTTGPPVVRSTWGTMKTLYR